MRQTTFVNGQPIHTEDIAEPPAETNRRTIEQRLRDDLAAMQQIIDTPNQSMDTAAMRKAVKAEARAMRRLIRHQLAAFDGAD